MHYVTTGGHLVKDATHVPLTTVPATIGSETIHPSIPSTVFPAHVASSTYHESSEEYGYDPTSEVHRPSEEEAMKKLKGKKLTLHENHL